MTAWVSNENGRAVLIAGPPAAGKSTIAKGLQAELVKGGELWLVVEFDNFARSMPIDWISFKAHRGKFADRGFAYEPRDERGLELIAGADARRVQKSFHRAVAALAMSGVNVICAAVVLDQADWDDWLSALARVPFVSVGLTASLETLETRERADRSRLFQGLARGILSSGDARGSYDLEIDTAANEPEAIVRQLAELIRS
jgi:chloramphenicol 3-O-phosphotransferase